MFSINDRLLAYKLCIRRVKIFTHRQNDRFNKFYLIQRQNKENKKQLKKQTKHKNYLYNKYLKIW